MAERRPRTRARARARHRRAVLDRLRQRRSLDLLRARPGGGLRARHDAGRLPDRRADLRCHRGDLRRGHHDVPGGRRLVVASPAAPSTSSGPSSPPGARCSTTSSRSRSRRSSCRTTWASSGSRCGESPGDIIGGIVVVVAARRRVNIVGVKESAGSTSSSRVADFATQVAARGASAWSWCSTPDTLVDNIHFGTAPTCERLPDRDPGRRWSPTPGIETISNMAEEARDYGKTIPRGDRAAWWSR